MIYNDEFRSEVIALPIVENPNLKIKICQKEPT